MIEKFWRDDLSPGRVVLFAASGKRTQELARGFVNTVLDKHDDAYFRWIVPQSTVVLDSEKEQLKCVHHFVLSFLTSEP